MSDPWAEFRASAKPAANDPWQEFRSKPAKPADTAWSDVPLEAVKNAPASAVNFAKGIVQPILHPVDTVQTIFNTGYGLASKAAGALGMQQDPAEKATDEATVDAIGGHFKDRYGSVRGLRQTLANDPVGAMADASIALTGGGAAGARLPGVAGRAAQSAGAVGRAIDPINATASAVGTVAGALPVSVLGATTGVGPAPIREAYQSGRAANPAFAENMRGQRPISDAVEMADAGVSAMVRDRGAAYKRNIAATKADIAPLDITPVQKALTSATNDIVHKGIVTDAVAAKTLTSMGELYDQFAALPVAERTAETFDALKKAIGGIRDTTQQGTGARRIADQVYNAVKAEIVKQSPSYADAMRNYSDASEKIGEIRRTLSVNDKASTDTTLRKLQSVMRNNVNTNYGQRTKLAEELGAYQPDLMPALAGQAMNSLAPRGIANALAGANTLYGMATMNPLALATLPLASPRFVGEGAYALGRGVGMAGNAANFLGGPALAELARYGYIAGNAGRPFSNLFETEDQR